MSIELVITSTGVELCYMRDVRQGVLHSCDDDGSQIAIARVDNEYALNLANAITALVKNGGNVTEEQMMGCIPPAGYVS